MMHLSLADRIKLVKPSSTLSLIAEVSRLRAHGQDIVSLEGGEPDFDTPDHIKRAAIAALNAGHTKYTPVDGTPTLKQAIVQKFSRDNGLNYQPDQVLVSCGAKQVFYNLCQALLNPGDEAIIPAPYWVSYPDIVRLAGATPVIAAAGIDQGFKLTASQLEAAITPRTRLFVLNSPSNPTGAVYSREELIALGDVLRKHPNVLVASDDIYERIHLNGAPFSNLAIACPDFYERVIVINGVSKAYSMTGWRIGYAAGPANLISAMKLVQSQSTSNPTSISQYAAEAALLGDQSCTEAMNSVFRERHDFLVKALNNIRGLRCAPSQGAFYSFPDVSRAIHALRLSSDIEFAQLLLKDAGVAVVPGSAFGASGYVRLSFAVGIDNLKKAVERIGALLERYPASEAV